MTHDELVEKVARAIYDAESAKDGTTCFSIKSDCEHGHCACSDFAQTAAQAAIAAVYEAIREPSEGMAVAGSHVIASVVASTCCHKTGGKGGPSAHANCECLPAAPATYRAMIDASPLLPQS